MAGRRRGVLAGILALVALTGQAAYAGPSIRVDPTPVIVSPGESVQLRASIQGPSEYRVRWILQGPLSEGGDVGTLSEDGLYTAPGVIPRGPVRVVVQVLLGQYNLPVAAASVPIDVLPPGMKPPGLGAATGFAPPLPPTPPQPPQPPQPPEAPQAR